MEAKNSTTVKSVSCEVLTSILSCYRDHCKYVKSAHVFAHDQLPLVASGVPLAGRQKNPRDVLMSLKAKLSIPDSCYIDDTGHFNAVEFNICYNQMIYLLMAHAVEQGQLDIGIADLAEYKYRMLPDILIIEMNNRFKRAMDSNNLYGTVSIHKCVSRGKMFILKTSCRFFDEHGGEQYGDVTLAIMKPEFSNTLSVA